MAKVDYEAPIEAIHGKLRRTDDVCFCKRKKSGTKYTQSRNDWAMTYTSDVNAQAAAARNAKFAAVARATSARLNDAQQKIQDQAAFNAQSKYTTLFGYVFHVLWNSYTEPSSGSGDE